MAADRSEENHPRCPSLRLWCVAVFVVVMVLALFAIRPVIIESNAYEQLGTLGYGSHGGNWRIPAALYLRLPDAVQRYFLSTTSVESGREILSDDDLAVLACFPRLSHLRLNALTYKQLVGEWMSSQRLHSASLPEPPVPVEGIDGWTQRNGYRWVRPHEFTDRGLAVLKYLTRLEVLDLADANLTDAGMAHPSGLSNLKWLDLSQTKITDAGLVHLANLTKLEHLNLRGTDVRGLGYQHLKNLTQLSEIGLPLNGITDATAEHIGKLTGLKKLYAYGAELSDVGVARLRHLTELEDLHLSGPKLTEDCLQQLVEMNDLKSRTVSCNGGADIGPGLAYLSGLSRLDRLELRDLSIGLDGWQYLPCIKSLRELHCDFANLNDVAGTNLARCEGLEVLRMCRQSPSEPVADPSREGGLTEVPARFLRELARSRRLRSLTFFGASFSDDAVDALCELQTLKMLSLYQSQLSDAQLARLKAALANCLIDEANRKSPPEPGARE